MAPKKDQIFKDTKNSGNNGVTTSGKSNSSANSANSASSGPFTRSKTKLATSQASQVTSVKSAQVKATVDDKLKPKKLPSVTEDDAAKNTSAPSSRVVSDAGSSSNSSSGSTPRSSNKPQSTQTLMQILIQ